MSIDPEDEDTPEKARPTRKTRSRHKRGGAKQKQDYPVGHGKPPKHTQFKKGQSGNPKGRPRKPKPAPKPPRFHQLPTETYLETEAYRELLLRENGKEITLPATQAILRALAAGAIQGKRLHVRDFFRLVRGAEKENFELLIQRYNRLKDCKREGERILTDCKRRGVDPPVLLPHPEDIVLRPATGEAWVNGPEDEDDLRFYEHSQQLRDHLVLVGSKTWKEETRQQEVDGVQRYNTGFVLAHLFNHFFPRRFQWKENEDVSLMLRYLSLTKPERERKIADEWARLQATMPPNRYLTPEMDRELDRIVAKHFTNKDKEEV